MSTIASDQQEWTLARAKWICAHRDQHGMTLRNRGSKMVGYHCCYVPAEMLTAAGVVPFRIMGDTQEPVCAVDTFLETQMCPHVRNCLELAVKGRYEFLDGVVIPHTCDAVQRVYGYWKRYIKPVFSHYLDVPHICGDPAVQFFRKELEDFQTSLENWTGKTISPDELRQAIGLHNENRALIRRLYSLRAKHPPLVSGTEVLQTLIAGLSLPVFEFNSLLEGVLQEISERPSALSPDAVRMLVSGCGIDDLPMMELIEDSGALVVMDDLPIGSRTFRLKVGEEEDPLEALSRSYLGEIHCGRTITGEKVLSYGEEVAQRFGYLMEYCREFDVGGVLLYRLRFCDPEQFDTPDLVDFLQTSGIRSLVIEDDYFTGNHGRLKTRIEAFVESLSL